MTLPRAFHVVGIEARLRWVEEHERCEEVEKAHVKSSFSSVLRSHTLGCHL